MLRKIYLKASLKWGFVLLTFIFCNSLNAQTKSDQFSVVIGKTPNDTLQVAIKDLQRYITRTVPNAKVNILKMLANDQLKATVIVLIDEKNPALVQLAKSYGIKQRLKEWNSFKISSFKQRNNPSNLIYFLQGADEMGRQYAIYGLVERLLGVRYLRPEEEYIPVYLNFKPVGINTMLQKPDYKWRGLHLWNYNYNDVGLQHFVVLMRTL